MLGLYPIIKPLLFRMDAEQVHHLTLNSLKRLNGLGLLPSHSGGKAVEVMGLTFPNAVGLAAGLDKNGDYIDALATLGFGSIEIGTVTPRPQAGNPKPRLFRVPQAEGVINRMGFNNLGVDHLVEQVQKAKFKGVLGINIGKNFDTPIDKAVDDYLIGLEKVYAHASYVTVNISSPNTANLRDLQQKDQLGHLLAELKISQAKLHQQHQRYVPVVVKIAPDMDEAQLQQVAEQLCEHEIDGVIATNTTLSRVGVEGMTNGAEQGGLSGAPLTTRSTEVVSQLSQHLAGKLPIIAAGGIMSAEDAAAKLAAGASLVQVYSGLIYRGPALVRDIVTRLAA